MRNRLHGGPFFSFILHRAIHATSVVRYAQSETCLHREYNLKMKNKGLRRIALRAHWKVLTRRACRVKNAEAFLDFYKDNCETLLEMKLYERFKQSAQALELLHERKMWNEQKTFCLSEAS